MTIYISTINVIQSQLSQVNVAKSLKRVYPVVYHRYAKHQNR